MCLDERNTERRGRLFPVRRSFDRTRWRRRRKRVSAFSGIGLLLLAFFPANRLGRILYALALVGFGRTIGAYLGRDLSDPLAVGAAHRDHGRPFAGDPDILGDRKGNVVTVAELQI